jgi:DNA-cytosine methyltransferase
MKHGSLFSGIGGMDLGFERAGMHTLWQVENDPYCLGVLERHWPDVPKYDDVRDFPPLGVEVPDVLSGGFPCQDISCVGKRKGIDGNQSGLWVEFARVIRELRPRYVVVENVASLLVRGIQRVLGDLAACGYDAEWFCLQALDFGLPHRRERVFIVAYPDGIQKRTVWNGRLPKGEVDDWQGLVSHFGDGAAARAARGMERDRLSRIKAVGNSVAVPMAEFVGGIILDRENDCE